MSTDTLYMAKCARAMLAKADLYFKVTDAIEVPNFERESRITLRLSRDGDDGFTFADADKLARLFKTKKINFGADKEGGGWSTLSGAWGGEAKVVVTVEDAKIVTKGVVQDPPPPKPKPPALPRSENPILCEHANEAPQTCPCTAGCYCSTRTCAPPPRDPGYYLIVARDAKVAGEWAKQRRVTPGQAVYVDTLEVLGGYNRKLWKIVVVNPARKQAPFTMDLVAGLKANGYEMLQE